MLLLVSTRTASRNGKSLSGGEIQDGLRPAVLHDLEIVFGEIGDEPALLVGDGEQNIVPGYVHLDQGMLVRFGCLGIRRGRAGGGDCWPPAQIAAQNRPAAASGAHITLILSRL